MSFAFLAVLVFFANAAKIKRKSAASLKKSEDGKGEPTGTAFPQEKAGNGLRLGYNPPGLEFPQEKGTRKRKEDEKSEFVRPLLRKTPRKEKRI